MYRQMKANKLSGEVVSHFTELIMRRQLKPGDKLPPERLLAEELGVSRTALREAVKMLEEKGLLDSKQGSGTYVCSPSSESISQSVSLYVRSDVNRYLELMELRSILDVELAGRLAESATGEDVAALTQHVERMWALLDNPEAFAAEDVAFHMTFYRALNNSVLMSIVQPIMVLLNDVMRMTFNVPGSEESSLRRHVALTDCIRQHDAEGARSTMRTIIERGQQRVNEHLRTTFGVTEAGKGD